MNKCILEQAGCSLSLQEWAHRLSQEPRALAAVEGYTGAPMFDLEDALEKVVHTEAVPNRPEDYLKPSGLEKLRAGRFDFKRADFTDTVPRLREYLPKLLPELKEQLVEWKYVEFEALAR